MPPHTDLERQTSTHEAVAVQIDEPRPTRKRRPSELTAVDWQTALRRQFDQEQNFGLKNLGKQPIFSDFAVSEPATGSRYRVVIRGQALGQNFCTCPDYATNDLGTCKHIEFTLGQLMTKRGGKVALTRGFQPDYSEIWLDYTGQRQVRWRAGANCPEVIQEQARKLFDTDDHGKLRDARYTGLPALLYAARTSGHELRCCDDVWQFVAQKRDAEQRETFLTYAYPESIRGMALSKLLKVKLYPYQVDGALFAVRAGRSLIADEMGLGKTIQAIAAAELFARHFGVQRVLVVCPASLKHQWKNEFLRCTEHDAQVIYGPREKRQQQYGESAFCKIIHYDTLASDADLIAAWAPDLVIADEAQRLKSWDTIAAQTLKRLASPYCMVLTGTSLETRPDELVSIVQFVDQHRLGPTWRLLDEHLLRNASGRVVGYRGLDDLGHTLAPVMLRRRKAEVLTQLPERLEHRLFVALTPEQRLSHDKSGDVVTRLLARWRRSGYLSDADQHRLHRALQNMRMACNSTFLLDRETDHGNKVDELMTLLEDLFQDPKAKAVVFSQWLSTHELIQHRLAERRWGHVLFSGQVSGEKCGALVEQFATDANCRLFLSTDATGCEFQLQHPQATVIHIDNPWNPAVLEQRFGRVHRFGQSRGVKVVHLIGQGSIEEGLLTVLAFKQTMFAGVLDGGEHEVFMQGTRLSKFMECVELVSGGMGEVQADPEASEEPLTVHEGSIKAVACDAPRAEDPWPAILEAGLALLQGFAADQSARSDGNTTAQLQIDRDPVTGQTSVRLPLPDPMVLQKLAKTLEPWLR